MINHSSTQILLNRIVALQGKLTEKESERLQFGWLAKAINRLLLLPIKDDRLEEMIQQLNEQATHLVSSTSLDNKQAKIWTRQIAALKKYLLNQYKLSKENHYTETYMALGMSLGMLLGAVIGLINALTPLLEINLLSISLPLGMLLGMGGGVGFGALLDAQAKAAGNTL